MMMYFRMQLPSHATGRWLRQGDAGGAGGWSPSLLDPVAQVGDSGCGHSLDQAQSDMGGQFLEEAAAVAEEHGNLVQDHLVEQSSAQCGSDDTAAHDRDVPIASSGASGLDAGFDGSDDGLLVRRLGWRRTIADHD